MLQIQLSQKSFDHRKMNKLLEILYPTTLKMEPKDLSDHELKAKYIMCSFDKQTGVLLQRNLFDLDINRTEDIQKNVRIPKNGFTHLMKMAKIESILSKPRLVCFY